MSKKAKTEAAVQTITPKTAFENILTCISVNRPYMLWGPPGIGKSDLVHQVGSQLGRKVRDIRLALYDQTEVKGTPYIQNGLMKWAPSCEFPQDPDADDILFLDELPSAPPSVQGAAYQLILNGRVGEYVLPKNCRIIAAGNRESDRGISYRMPKPLANRFVHGDLRVDVDQWLDYAIRQKVHKDVVGYVSHMKQDLFDFEPTSASHAFATPRSWFFVDQIVKNASKNSNESFASLISGTIGEGIAIKFINHCKIADKLPFAIDVLEGRVKKFDGVDISATYSLIISMCYEIKLHIENNKPKDLINKYLDNYLQFMLDHFQPEMIMAGVKILITNYDVDFDIENSKVYAIFDKKYGKYISA